jgi:ethanolamine utilization microcompartment shell protein EutL
MKMILEAKDIPINSLVSKVNGSNIYILSKDIAIYEIDGSKKKINVDNNCFFLIPKKSESFSISCISGDKELIWYTTKDKLLNYLNNDEV